MRKLLHPAACWIVMSLAALTGNAIADDGEQRAAPRVDIYGDPLPEGALARLGTVRYRACCSSNGRIEFLADGQTLLGCDGQRLRWLDAPSGRVVLSVDLDVEYAALAAVTRDRSLAAVSTRRYLRGENDKEYGVAFVDTSDGTVHSRLQYRAPSYRRFVASACFTPDGDKLVTGDYEGVVRVWAVATGREEAAYSLPTPEEVRRLTFSPDGQWLVATNYRAAFRRAWPSEEVFHQFGRPDERVLTAEFSPDSRLVALGFDSRGAIRLFDVASGSEVREFRAPERWYYVEQLAFTSDGSRIIAPSAHSFIGERKELPGEVDVWDVASGELVHSLPYEEGLRRVAISPDDRWVAASIHEGTVAVWDITTGKRAGDEFFGHRSSVGALAVSPDGAQVVTAGSDGLAVLWETESGRPVHVFRHWPGKMVSTVEFSSDGRWVATSALDDTLGIWDRANGERIHTLIGHGELGGRRTLRFTSDSRRLLSFGDDWFLRAFNVESGKAELEHAIRPSGLPLKENPDGSVNRDDEEMMFTPPSGNFTPDGATFVMTVGTNLYVFDVQTGKERARHKVGPTGYDSALSPDGMCVATKSRRPGVQTPLPGGGVRVDMGRAFAVDIRNVATGQVETTLEAPPMFNSTITFSPDGTKLTMSQGDIRVLDIASGRELARIEPETRAVSGVAFTPDGERLVVAHADATALVWDWRKFPVMEEKRP
jgi:WD40 repeat protein